ncbi:MAG: serine--tRNA ligase [Bradymonadales bacterium]|nr:MAG: serine--tRNA ligase [Bradymonadales bacterium]
MFDLRELQDNFDQFEKAWAKRKSAELMKLVSSLKSDLAERKSLIFSHEQMLSQRNQAVEEIARLKKAGGAVQEAIAAQKELGPKIKASEEALKFFESRFDEKVLSLPNCPQESVPEGASEADNREVSRWGQPRSFDFPVLSHEELGKKRQWILLDEAARMTGARFSILKGAVARLERALIQFMLDRHTSESQYEEVVPPYIVNSRSLVGTGNLPKFKEDLFHLEGTDYFLIPTAEVSLTNLHQGEILEASELPKYYTAYTPCFRSEAGSHGKDLKGLIRQHQFAKVELVKIVHPEKSEQEHQGMLKDAQAVLEALELPYRCVELCSADLGFASSKTYDLEVWLPSQNQYREISSVSNCLDFQARRMKTRFREAKEKPRFVHTLNGSGLAVGRTIIAILENFQDKEGRVQIPARLRPYMDGREFL